MGSLVTTLRRPSRLYDVENRAQKILSREKPVPSPPYESTIKQKKIVEELYPDYGQEMIKKNDSLDKRLKDVFVVTPQKDDDVKARLLPQEKLHVPKVEVEDYEPAIMPEGKCSIKTVYDFIAKHKDRPEIFTAQKIAVDHNLDVRVVSDILKHFKLVTVIMKTADQLKLETNIKKDTGH